MPVNPSEVEAFLSLILDWHQITRRLHGHLPYPLEIRRNEWKLQIQVVMDKNSTKSITTKLAGAAEKRGIDTTPFWDLTGNLDGAAIEAWDQAWSVVNRLTTKLLIELPPAGNANRDQERWERVLKQSEDSIETNNAILESRRATWGNLRGHAVAAETEGLVAEGPDDSLNGTQKRKKRKRAAGKKNRPLTAKQLEAVQIIGECKGNFAEAGRQLGRDRKTIEQHYKAAMKKLGKVTIEHQTKKLPTDRRGQEHLADGDDRRGI